MDYAGNWPWISLTEQSLIWNKVIPAVSHDSAKASNTKDINSPLQVGVQFPCLTTIEYNRDHQWLEDLNLCPSAQVLTTPNTHAEWVHITVCQANPLYNFLARPTIVRKDLLSFLVLKPWGQPISHSQPSQCQWQHLSCPGETTHKTAWGMLTWIVTIN